MSNFLNKLLCGLGNSAQHKKHLLNCSKHGKRELDNLGFIGIVLIDLLKANDCLHHNILFAKLGAYGLDRSSQRLLMGYLNCHKQ